MIHYVVKGIPPGASFEIGEVRTLIKAGQTVATFEEKVPRPSGTFVSAQEIDVAPGTAPGIYSYEAEVSIAGVTAKGSALFEVQ